MHAMHAANEAPAPRPKTERQASIARLESGYLEEHFSPRALLTEVRNIWGEVRSRGGASGSGSGGGGGGGGRRSGAAEGNKTARHRELLTEARRAMADEYLVLSESDQEEWEFQEHCRDGKTPYYASLNAALAHDSTALLRAEFLQQLAAEGKPLGHRAQLPSEAFYEGPIWGEDGQGVLIVALSYMWATADHPDPNGEQLRDVAEFLRWMQGTPHNGHSGKQIAVFWDWASLYQDKPEGSRSEEQTLSFQEGLRNCNLWYCHPLTLTLMNRKRPEGRERGYDESGWAIFERGVSEFVKDKKAVLCLHAVLAALADEGVEEWKKKDFGQMAQVCGELAKSAPPLSPVAMSDKLRAAFFTNGADVEFVEEKYEATFRAVLTTVKKLSFVKMDWVPPEAWVAFCEQVVPQCAELEELWLSNNQHLAMDIAALVAALPPTLKELRLHGTGCFGDCARADWGALRALEKVDLKGTNVSGSIENFVGRLPATVKHLNIGKTGVSGDGAAADWARLSDLQFLDLMDSMVAGSKEDLNASGCKATRIFVNMIRL